ncbi:uncharacterized protein LOC132256127 isoform X2 [Phlebotomus argentipes]|uniref:uncharacterized protein LOC132256127 isoform X2 n=1 Tax=Phlebotomus argentipes TaxID=94469 RepID=UPI002893453E|nr:uncharacterized protein LOC132256127 isoform X2 [Phlebotomus argentipes]
MAFDQQNGAWPIDHPLPLPAWSSRERPRLVVDKVWQYEELAAMTETVLQRMLEETFYDTVHNFLDFHGTFRGSGGADLRLFFQHYTPPVNRRHHMCVSLAMEIVTRLADVLPTLAEHLFIVSCEEAVESAEPYIANCHKGRSLEGASHSLEKEHALIAVHISVAGREGLMILDPGYHVARAVTVMKDLCYPHTGWFTQSDEPHCRREYCYSYSLHSTNFVEWSERTTRGSTVNHELALIYVERPYKTAIDVTVRRNLVYNFRSLLARNAKGRVCAGLYFPVVPGPDAQLTLFYDGVNNASVKAKVKFSTFNRRDSLKIRKIIGEKMKMID